ncbi:MAG: tetratricopeptide repeat protein [Desulfovibrionaceae bacterium]|nr:tetratricopeptide repeat protein [Desulfovibrionaceae bacterium]
MPASALMGRKAVILFVLACVAVMFAASFIYRMENPNLFVKGRAGGQSGGESAMGSGPMSQVREFMARVEADPKDVEALVGLGNSFLMMRAWDRALEPLAEANRLEPGNTAVLKGIGIAYFNKEAFDKAAAAYEAILKIDPEDTLALFNLGVIYKHYFKKEDVAGTYFEKVLALEKDDAEMIKLARQELGK